jgi:ubiquinone/menaquinone biosynthesis C-methylase UbiE
MPAYRYADAAAAAHPHGAEMMENTQEISRIRSAYDKRMREGAFERYSLVIPGELYMVQRREEHMLSLLRKHRVHPLKGKKILEIGCGRGSRLADWARWGAAPQDLFGIDLMPQLIAEAKKNLPAAQLSVGSADRLEFGDHSFDIVVQYTMFTSILDYALKQNIAAEMRRVLKPGGVIVWYDFRYPNPSNPDVKPVGAGEIARLFPGCRVDKKLVTLLPPLARLLA